MSDLFKLNSSDFKKGLVMAVIGGAVLPILAALQTPGFDVSTVNLSALATLAINGALAAFASYLTKNLFTDSEGKFAGIL
jgi:hypothetical protein